MKHLVAVALFAAVLAACDDDPSLKPKAPTAPELPAAPAPSLENVSARVRGSSVCSSYLRERSRLQAKLAAAPNDTALSRRAHALVLIIVDACN
jgi:hypothetical protein